MPYIDVGDISNLGPALQDIIHTQILRDEAAVRFKVAAEVVARAEAKAIKLTNAEGLVYKGVYKLGWRNGRIAGGWELRNDTPYAGVLELGRRPMRPGPPLAPIREWVRRKALKGGTEEEIERMAVAVQKKIHVKGTKGRRVLYRVWTKDVPKFIKAAIKLHLPTNGGI